MAGCSMVTSSGADEREGGSAAERGRSGGGGASSPGSGGPLRLRIVELGLNGEGGAVEIWSCRHS